MTILDLDVGNSRVKWRASDGANVSEGTLDRGDAAALPSTDLSNVRRVRVSSVAGRSWDDALTEATRHQLGIEVEFARTVAGVAGVTCGYDVPATLGVDRWMAVLGAWQRCHSAAVVIDCGTALTVDAVTAAGTHVGGYIVPGLALMVGSLDSDTAGIEVSGLASQTRLAPGTNTADAVRRGIVCMLADFLDAAVARFQHQCDDRAHVYVCGGDADIIAPHLTASKAVVPGLVLDGLAIALP